MFKLLVVSAVLALALAAPSSKITSDLKATLKTKAAANIIISMKDDTTQVLARLTQTTFSSRDERLNTVASSLKAHAIASQKSILEFLSVQPFTTTVRSFWITNQIYVKNANAALIKDLSARPDVGEISEEILIPIAEPTITTHDEQKTLAEPRAEWGIDKVKAPQAWALPGGNNGIGVIVSNVDTGVRRTHISLVGNFRGDYGWYDGYNQYDVPTDQNGHGTHTMGTIAGQGGIGVAPGSRWAACRGCSTSSCAQSALLACGEWIACPTLPNGQDADCTKAPHVVNNSWGGGRGDTWYNGVIAAWHASGVIPVFSNGNSGPGCNSANSPADQDCIAVGSTTNSDGLSSFSSVGPRAAGGIKPDISAPGQDVRSAYYTSDNAYTSMSGTSMAGPHVAGVVALLQGSNPDLSYPQIQTLIFESADHNIVSTGRNCGGIDESIFPNNAFGHGRVDALAALTNLISGKGL